MSSSLTKPTIVSSNIESTNGGTALSTEKRAPIVMRIPKLNFFTNKVKKLIYFIFLIVFFYLIQIFI